MYDLPSEEVGEPGMPDEFHVLQPSLLRETFQPPGISPEAVFTAADMNLYYDPRHLGWYKRPDWFAVLGVPRRYEGRDMRLSYVVWQEGMAPTVVLEMLSPGTEDEDLGQRLPRGPDEPPPKWEVYERILQVPLYLVYSRYTEELRAFWLKATGYAPLPVAGGRCWLREIGLGIGLWQGEHLAMSGTWLRWYDHHGRWIPTAAERERERAERLAQRLRALGFDPDALD
jgi:Uma2 family endonuclease